MSYTVSQWERLAQHCRFRSDVLQKHEMRALEEDLEELPFYDHHTQARQVYAWLDCLSRFNHVEPSNIPTQVRLLKALGTQWPIYTEQWVLKTLHNSASQHQGTTLCIDDWYAMTLACPDRVDFPWHLVYDSLNLKDTWGYYTPQWQEDYTECWPIWSKQLQEDQRLSKDHLHAMRCAIGFQILTAQCADTQGARFQQLAQDLAQMCQDEPWKDKLHRKLGHYAKNTLVDPLRWLPILAKHPQWAAVMEPNLKKESWLLLHGKSKELFRTALTKKPKDIHRWIPFAATWKHNMVWTPSMCQALYERMRQEVEPSEIPWEPSVPSGYSRGLQELLVLAPNHFWDGLCQEHHTWQFAHDALNSMWSCWVQNMDLTGYDALPVPVGLIRATGRLWEMLSQMDPADAVSATSPYLEEPYHCEPVLYLAAKRVFPSNPQATQKLSDATGAQYWKACIYNLWTSWNPNVEWPSFSIGDTLDALDMSLNTWMEEHNQQVRPNIETLATTDLNP